MTDKVFNTTLVDGSGAHPFELTVREAKRTGQIKLPEGDVLSLKDVARTTAGQIVCWMLIGRIPVKLVLGTAENGGTLLLTMVIAGTPRRYQTADANAFQAFIAGLRVPAGSLLDDPPSQDSAVPAGEVFEPDAKDSAVQQVQAFLSLAHRAHERDVHFTDLWINDVLQIGYPEGQFPGNQGIVVSLGLRDHGEVVRVRWRIAMPPYARPPYALRAYFGLQISRPVKVADYPDAGPGQVLEGTCALTVP